MKKWMEKISRWRFDKKMQLLVTVSIVSTTLIVLVISTVSSVTSMRQQSVELLQAQNNTMAENFKSSLDNYKALAVATVLDTSIQQYLKETDDVDERSRRNTNAYNMLASISNMHSDMNFIAVVGSKGEKYIYKGQKALVATRFSQVYSLDAQMCKTVQNSSIKMCFNNAYFDGNQYTLNIYFPVYDTNRVLGELGLLCMNFSDSTLEQVLNAEDSSSLESAVLDTDGMLVSTRNREEIGKKVEYITQLKDRSGTFNQDGKLYLYQKVANWDFYMLSSVPTMELYKSSIRTIVLMAFIMLFLLTVSFIVVKRIISKVYRPLDKVVRKMDDVASGSLKTRINVEHMGEDFTKLALGFNSMMEEIQVLMEQVKMEQHQIEQIRFNALQSQIQPHFLYNTLECIHWQAMADGNEEISTLVKALAKYYRICLSGGHDVIPLKMELEHVRNYMIIQNMRYDNIIGCEFEVDGFAEETMIPKLTLQPLVENSIYHGIKVKEGKTGKVFVKVSGEGDVVHITLADTGTGMTEEQIGEMNQHLSEYDDSFGYGVRNVNKRIELLYGKEYGLHYKKNESGGVTVEILLPYTTEVQEGILRGDMIHV